MIGGVLKPFIKWAGGKRWLMDNQHFELPSFSGRYFEPFLGGGAVFFNLAPRCAILADINPKLISTYQAIKDDWRKVYSNLKRFQARHSKDFYYEERARVRRAEHAKAAQFLYLNRTCFNGLYRENRAGKFNVPIGSKDSVLLPDDDFEGASKLLQNAELRVSDFQSVIQEARAGDLVFVDPPYTIAHNSNGFLNYNQKIFSWSDQERLRNCVEAAVKRGARVVVTNANHESIHKLYKDLGNPMMLERSSVISGSSKFRGRSSEAVFVL